MDILQESNSVEPGVDIEMHALTGTSIITGTVPRLSLNSLPLVTTPDSKVDPENLTPLEQEIYDLPADQWQKL